LVDLLKKYLSADIQPEPPKLSSPLFSQVPTELRALVPSYVKNRQNEAGELAQCLDQGDFEKLKRVGHNLKGNGSTYGFAKLSEIGQKMEVAAVEKQSDTLKDLISSYSSFVQELQLSAES